MKINSLNSFKGESLLETRRRRRDTMPIRNGGLIIGSADDPIPCDRKIIIKINGDEKTQSFAALPDSIPLGNKVIGGTGGIRMFGCEIKTPWTFLSKTARANQNAIDVQGDVSGNRNLKISKVEISELA